MGIFSRLRDLALGRQLDPFNPQVFRHIALVAFFAWIGLGADGLSSSCYGPEEAYLALGHHTHLALYIAIATAITVFVIAFSYNQVIELFPSGGGGYKVATQLLHPYAGLVSGAALIVDYMLTITISIASGTDALFSFLPTSVHSFQHTSEILLVIFLIILNLRGMKESIEVLLPIFLGFVITHIIIILYGIFSHRYGIMPVINDAVSETNRLKSTIGWLPLIGLILHSYSLGAGTYTGLEAVSNNVHHLAEPRVQTGKWTMFYIAVSLSFTAAGLILLYLLWNVQNHPDVTLNASVFREILGNSFYGNLGLLLLLVLEAGLLFVAANTGFIAGPATLANMALDDWVPSRFRHLSTRLVMQNSILLYGFGAICLLLWTKGQTHLLVILYSINVFITFSLSLLGLCTYWFKNRSNPNWFRKFSFSILGFVIASSILIIMIVTKFVEGGWVTLVITSGVVTICLYIKRHYNLINKKLKKLDSMLTPPVDFNKVSYHHLDPTQPTAIIFISKSRGIAMHTLLAARRMFPNYFKNFIFLSAGIVDIESFHGQDTLEKMRQEVESNLEYFVQYCQQHGFAAEGYAIYATDIIDPLIEQAQKICSKYSECTYFASKLVLEKENWLTRQLDNETSIILQRHIFALGRQLIILPMKI